MADFLADTSKDGLLSVVLGVFTIHGVQVNISSETHLKQGLDICEKIKKEKYYGIAPKNKSDQDALSRLNQSLMDWKPMNSEETPSAVPID